MSGALELAVALVVGGSVLALASVRPWAHVPLWAGCALALALAVGRILSEDGSGALLGLRPPLLVPGLLFALWVSLQLAPLPLDGGGRPWRPITLSPADTLRGLAFVVSGLALHVAAFVSLDRRQPRRRFRAVVAGVGLVVALVALLQLASGAASFYWLFEPLEARTVWGPFANRNHLAGYMLLVIPVCLGRVMRAHARYSALAGRSSWRRRLVALSTPQGIGLIDALAPALLCTGALVATASRGGLVAFAAALGLAGLGQRRRSGVWFGLLALVLVATPLAWFGLERLVERFSRAGDDARGRVVIWRESLEHARERPLTGSGFNTFALEVSRVAAWELPLGATPWPEALGPALAGGERIGYRAPSDLPGLDWYREAHNDFLQLLVETGVPGLALGIWGAAAALVAARRDPWLFAALAGLIAHALVDFDFQIPCIPMLFVALAALPRGERRPRDGA